MNRMLIFAPAGEPPYAFVYDTLWGSELTFNALPGETPERLAERVAAKYGLPVSEFRVETRAWTRKDAA